MDPNGSGDHHEVQAAAGRAVGGGPPSSARAAASTTASSLPPPGPLATDAAVQTRATESEDWWASAAAAAATGIEYPPSDEEAPQTPAQIGTNYDVMEGAIKEPMERIEMDGNAPVPPVQTAVEYEKMENTIKKAVQQTQSEDAPLPPPQIAALTDEERGEDEMDAKKKAAPTTEVEGVSPPTPAATSPLQEQDEGTPARSHSADPPASRPPSTDHGQISSGHQPIDAGPPPRTPSVPASGPPRDPSAPVLEATLVEERPEAIVVPDLPLIDAVPLEEHTWLKKNKKYIFGGCGLLIGAVTAGVSVSSNGGGSGSNASSNPSQSVKPSFRPTASSSRSQIPSPPRSSMPTPTPPLYCGEINILIDESYWQTSWQIRNTVIVSGISYPNEIVLERAPKEEGHHTYEACLERGNYEFAIFDFVGDGIDSPGYYNVTFEGILIAQGGAFGSEETVSFSLPSWNRQGLGFNGDASDDRFGRAVAFSADASTVAVGAPGLSDYDDRPGYVKVYRREGEGSSWEQRGDTLHGEAYGDNFGRSLSLSEDGMTLSIGAPQHDSVVLASGQVKVYEWDEAALNYVQIGDTLYGAASVDLFGYSLDISNSRILAVADASDANGINSGQVTIYAWDDASSNFKQRGEAINGDAAGDEFGFSVSLAENGQKLAVSAHGNDSNGSSSGQVRAFEWDEATSNYEQLGDSLFGDAANDRFGWSMSFSRDGTTLAIGAPSKSENGQWMNSGQLRVFEWDEAILNYKQLGDSLLGDAAGDWFGESVSFSGDGTTFAVGAPANSENSPLSGQVKVFAWNEVASNFVQIGQSLYGKAAIDEFGISVSLSSEGKTLAVGASQRLADKPGYVEVYEWDKAASEYKRLGQILSSEASDDGFGGALALAGNGRDLAVGAPWNARNGTESGRLEVFNIEL